MPNKGVHLLRFSKAGVQKSQQVVGQLLYRPERSPELQRKMAATLKKELFRPG
jgi:hypothetical protein